MKARSVDAAVELAEYEAKMALRKRAREVIRLSRAKPMNYKKRNILRRLKGALDCDYYDGIEVETKRLLDLMAKQDREG